ncbi:MAG TPA: hypothetical protein VMT29_08050 [Steroidobacteraceae bacterium]|nr:hypothetical protein [Steroidobacteraceae bacterium]
MTDSGAVSVIQGATSAPITVGVAGSNGFTGVVTVSISGVPTGAVVSPAFPLSIKAGSAAQFTIAIPGSTPPGNTTVTLTGTSAGTSHAAPPVTLTIMPAIQTSQSNGVLYLTSHSNGHTVRIGLDTAWGGSIVEVSLDGTNFVNAHDTGREVQPGLYAGSDSYIDYNCNPCNPPWGWDPVLGGDKYGHGSPVLSQQMGATTIDVKGQPLQWDPDNFGGGANSPVTSDVTVEQTVSLVPGYPLAFKVHWVITHTGTDQHYNTQQELPAVYVGSQYNVLSYYGGGSPWTNDTVTVNASPPASPDMPLFYSTEEWVAYSDQSGNGLSIIAPGQYPYVVATTFGGGGTGPAGNATNYVRPFSVFTFGPSVVLERDIYLIPGDVTTARSIAYALHDTGPAPDVLPPMGNMDAPGAGASISGTAVTSAGWAVDNIAVSSVEVLVDGADLLSPVLNTDRPDVVKAFPKLAPLQCGWNETFDSTKIANGPHVFTVRITDTAGNVALLPPVRVIVSN